MLSRTARSGLRDRIDTAIRRGTATTGAAGQVPTERLTAFPSLDEHLYAASSCAHGRLIEPGDTGPAIGPLLPPRQRVQTVGAVVAAVLAARLPEPPSPAMLQERLGWLDATTDDSAVGLVPPRRGDIARHLFTTTWVALRSL